MTNIREQVRKNRTEEIESQILDIIHDLNHEGLMVEFGTIGVKTTYALVYDADHNVEYVGYTFIRNIKYYNENTGKLKALQQALARKETLDTTN